MWPSRSSLWCWNNVYMDTASQGMIACHPKCSVSLSALLFFQGYNWHLAACAFWFNAAGYVSALTKVYCDLLVWHNKLLISTLCCGWQLHRWVVISHGRLGVLIQWQLDSLFLRLTTYENDQSSALLALCEFAVDESVTWKALSCRGAIMSRCLFRVV